MTKEKFDAKKYKVAIIEDDHVISKSLAGALADTGFRVLQAFDGESGLALILAEKPDLVLLDIDMPIIDGMTMLAKLRTSGIYGKHVSVILLTNLSADDKIMGGVTKDEPSYYLIKSDFTMENVIEKIKNCLAPTEELTEQQASPLDS